MKEYFFFSKNKIQQLTFLSLSLSPSAFSHRFFTELCFTK